MGKYVVMEVYSVEAESAESAKATAEGATSQDGVVFVAESLGQMMNPVHWADAQNKFGHLKAEAAPAEVPATETKATPENI